MASSNNKELMSKASPHTIKKFELIEEYIKSWAQKLMLNQYCNGIIFIDCMCNSGLYHDENGILVEGTPIRVARVLADVMREQNYQAQQAWLYFNDLSQAKITELRKHLPDDTRNFHIYWLFTRISGFLFSL